MLLLEYLVPFHVKRYIWLSINVLKSDAHKERDSYGAYRCWNCICDPNSK